MITRMDKDDLLKNLKRCIKTVDSIPTAAEQVSETDDQDDLTAVDKTIEVVRGETQMLTSLVTANHISIHQGGTLHAPRLKYVESLSVSGEFIGGEIERIGELHVSDNGKVSIINIKLLKCLIASSKVHLPGVAYIDDVRVYGLDQNMSGEVYLPDVYAIGNILFRGNGKIHVRKRGIEIRHTHHFNDRGEIHMAGGSIKFGGGR